MKALKTISVALLIGLLITGCSSKKEKENTPEEVTKNTPYKIDITDEPLRVYDGEGNLVAEDIIEKVRGYNIGQGNSIISVDFKTEDEKNYMIINGKSSGKAELSIYTFDPDDHDCTSKSSYTFVVDSNLNVSVSGLDGSYGSCDTNIDDVTVIK